MSMFTELPIVAPCWLKQLYYLCSMVKFVRGCICISISNPNTFILDPSQIHILPFNLLPLPKLNFSIFIFVRPNLKFPIFIYVCPYLNFPYVKWKISFLLYTHSHIFPSYFHLSTLTFSNQNSNYLYSFFLKPVPNSMVS